MVIDCDRASYPGGMSDPVGEGSATRPVVGSPGREEPVDLSVLERIEGELHAVERALEQIDQGVYDGFVGLEPEGS